MRISAYLTNGQWFLACLCGLLLAPGLWVLLIALQVIAEAIG